MLLELTTSFRYKREPFWIFWQGITCLLPRNINPKTWVNKLLSRGSAKRWGILKGITCLLVSYTLMSFGISGVTQGLIIPGIELKYNPTKSTSINYYSNSNLEISLTSQAPSSQCQFSYKAYKSLTWLQLPTTNNNPCQTTLTKVMRANDLVIDIKVNMTNSDNNTTQTLTDSYVFKSL